MKQPPGPAVDHILLIRIVGIVQASYCILSTELNGMAVSMMSMDNPIDRVLENIFWLDVDWF